MVTAPDRTRLLYATESEKDQDALALQNYRSAALSMPSTLGSKVQLEYSRPFFLCSD